MTGMFHFRYSKKKSKKRKKKKRKESSDESDSDSDSESEEEIGEMMWVEKSAKGTSYSLVHTVQTGFFFYIFYLLHCRCNVNTFTCQYDTYFFPWRHNWVLNPFHEDTIRIMKGNSVNTPLFEL